MTKKKRGIRHLKDGVAVYIRGPIAHTQQSWSRGQFYEQPMLNYIREHYRGGTFIDGGACIGNHTLFFARYCAAQVIAVEPVPRNMQHLMSNVALSQLNGKVKFVEAALSNYSGRGSMQQMSHYPEHHNLAKGDTVTVMTLDELAGLAEHPITLVKLDIQWQEFEALSAAHNVLTEHHPALFIELVDPVKDRAPVDGLLAKYGYERGRKFGGAPTYEYIWRGNV